MKVEAQSMEKPLVPPTLLLTITDRPSSGKMHSSRPNRSSPPLQGPPRGRLNRMRRYRDCNAAEVGKQARDVLPRVGSKCCEGEVSNPRPELTDRSDS